jgi:hypothetical protein
MPPDWLPAFDDFLCERWPLSPGVRGHQVGPGQPWRCARRASRRRKDHPRPPPALPTPTKGA